MKNTTVLQICTRFTDPLAGGVVDLRDLDFGGVNMQDEKVKRWFKRVAELFTANISNPPLFIDMTGANVSGVDLRGYDLSNVAMDGIKARGAIFIKCMMSDTHMEGADLENADFRLANLNHAKLYEANIRGVNFSGANLINAHGLELKNPEKIVERLGVASTIRDAILPEEAERMRDAIQSVIRAGREKIPEYSANLLEYEDKQEPLPQIQEKQTLGGGLFSSEWLKQAIRETEKTLNIKEAVPEEMNTDELV